MDILIAPDFNVQDNNFRFLGGTWIGIGLAFLAGAFAFQWLLTALVVLCALVLFGGFARLSDPDIDTLGNALVSPSLFAKLIVFPLLG